MCNYKLLLGDAGCITSLIRARRLDLLDVLPVTFRASSHTTAEALDWEHELGNPTTRLSGILHDFIFKTKSPLSVSMAGRYGRSYYALYRMQERTPSQRERQVRANVVGMQFLGAESLLKLIKPFQHLEVPDETRGILYTDPYLPLIQERIRTQFGEEVANATHFIPLAAYLGTLRSPMWLDDFKCFAKTHPLGRQGGFVFSGDAEKMQEIKALEEPVDKENIRSVVLSVDREDATLADLMSFWPYIHALGGMRPKYVFLDKGVLWQAKTVSQEDVFADGVLWEAVNLTMASRCGITVPPFTYQNGDNGGNGWLCVQRFDRENGIPVPYISAKTLLLAHETHEDNRHYSYADIADRCNKKDAQEVFRRCCFNVAVANCDDHLKNHGFLLKNGDWTLSPVFDVMSMPVPACAQEHSLVIGNSSRFGTLQNIVADAHRFHLSAEEAAAIAKEIFNTVMYTWEDTARAWGANDEKMAYMASAYVHDRNCA